MQFDLEVRGSLERVLNVQLSEQRFKRDIVRQLESLGENPETEGFLSDGDMLQQLDQCFGKNIRENAVSGLIKVLLEEVTKQEEIVIAGKPELEITEPKPGYVFAINAAFEIYPSISLPYIETCKFTQLVAQLSEKDVERAITSLRRQMAAWSAVERPAQAGDSVIINFHADAGERTFDAQGMRIELSGDDIVEGFEKGLMGTSAGEKLALELDFPEHHYQKEMAGKTVVFNVEVIRVEAEVLPELDADFIKSQGIQSGDLTTFRDVVRRNMDNHLQQTIRLKNMLATMDNIIEQNPFEVPRVLIEEELTRLTCDPCEEVEGVESFEHKLDPAVFADLAHKRAVRSLLVSELARSYNIELETEEVKVRLNELVSEYPQKERIVEWFYEDKVRLAGIESDVLSEQVTYWILAKMSAEKVETSYSEMMNF